MTWISVDVEADGPAPGLYSMVCFGAVVVDKDLDKTFYGTLKPVSDLWIPEALAVSGFTREETLRFDKPEITMQAFNTWVTLMSNRDPIFVADNNGFDWSFINWYFWNFVGVNPFGFSSKNLNNLWQGLQKNTRKSFKHLRITKHDHNPVNDAKGNAEALLQMVEHFGLEGTGINV